MHRAHRIRERSESVLTSRPMSPSTQLKFLLAWGQGRHSPDSQSPLGSRHRLHSKLSNSVKCDRSASSSGRPSIRRRRSLTYVPVSAWVKDFKDEDDTDGCSRQTTGTARRSMSQERAEPRPTPPPRPPPRASRSAQRSPPPPLPPPRAPRPLPRKSVPPPPTPTPPPTTPAPPSPTSAPTQPTPAPPPQSQIQLTPPISSQSSPEQQQDAPPTPHPHSLAPPAPPARVASAKAPSIAAAVAVTSQRRTLRHTSNISHAELREAAARSASRTGAVNQANGAFTESSRKRRELRRPSDVAVLLHEILAGRASRYGAGETLEVAAPAAGAASAKSSKPAHGSGAGRAVKNQDDPKRHQQKRYKKPEKSRSYSSESNIVDTLAEIIAEKITRADRRRHKYDSKGDTRPKVSSSSTNQPKDKADCDPGTEKTVVKVKRHSKRSGAAADGSLCRHQQNCSNCYEKPPKRSRTRQLCQLHALSMHSSAGVNSQSGDGWNNATKSLRLSSVSPKLRSVWGLSNRSNAGNCRTSNQILFDGKLEPSEIPATVTPESEFSQSDEHEDERRLADQETASGTCSTDEESNSTKRPSLSLLSTQAVRHQQLSGVEVASVSRSSESSLSVSKLQKDLPIASAGQQIVTNQSTTITDRLSSRERQTRQKTTGESQNAASYKEDLFSGLLKGRDESNLLLPIEEAPPELRLNWVPTDAGGKLGGGDCEATINIIEPESILRTNRRERVDVLNTNQAYYLSSDQLNTSRSEVAEKLQQFSQTRSSISISSEASRNRSNLQLARHSQRKAPELWLNSRQAPCIGCEDFNVGAKTVGRKRATLRRRSRVNVVEPLADAVQYRIEMPSCIIEESFSSWRPLKRAQHLKDNLTFVSLENIASDLANQPVSVFCHHCVPLLEVDATVVEVPSGKICTIESILFRFARYIASRIVSTLSAKCCLLDSTIELAGGLLNRSMLSATHPTEASVVRSSVCLHQRCSNRRKPDSSSFGQNWSPCCFYWAECCRGVSARRAESHERVELLQVVSNLPTQNQQLKDEGGYTFNERLDGCGSSLTRCFCDDALLEQSRPTHHSKRLKPSEARSTELFTKLGSKRGHSRSVVTHCPELVANPNLDLTTSTIEDSEDSSNKKADDKMPEQAPSQPSCDKETASSVRSSSESSVLTLGNQLHQPIDQCNTKLSSKAAGDKFASISDQSNSQQPPDDASTLCQSPVAAAGQVGRSSQPDQLSYRCRSFLSGSSRDATPSLSESERDAHPMLSITCQLTMADCSSSDATTSNSFDESLPAWRPADVEQN